MWQKSLDFNSVTGEVRPFTTAVWDFVDGEERLATVGVLRMSAYSDAFLWLKAHGKTYGAIRRVFDHMQELHSLIGDKIVYAEVDKALPMNYKFLKKCGFEVCAEDDSRILMMREI